MITGQDSFETMKLIGLEYLKGLVKIWNERGFDPIAVYYASKKIEVIFYEILRGLTPQDKQGEFEGLMQEFDDMMLQEKEEFGMREQIEAAIKRMKGYT